MKLKMEDLVNFTKQYGYIFQGSEIYDGLSNTWDYGPLGTLLKENLKKAWLKKFVQESDYNVSLDAAILMNPNVWVTSGHVSSFADPLIDCKNCKTRFRVDQLIEDYDNSIKADGWSNEEYEKFINENKIKCQKCGKEDFTPVRKFNLLFETHIGVTEDNKNKIYLRGETAQGIFVNFKNVERSMRLSVPFGIAQIGKAFRNEITPGNFIFRMREFEQMELEFFCKPGTDLEWFKYWKDYMMDFLVSLGIDKDKLRFRDHSKEELSFYSVATTDIEFNYPMGWGELWGIADRTDYDLGVHMKATNVDLRVLDPVTNEKYLPYVIEPSLGLDRLFLAVIANAYTKDIINEEERIVLKLHPFLAPVKVVILPLIKKIHGDVARELYKDLRKHFETQLDESGSIGKRYRRSEAIGVPFAITIDDDTLANNKVTIRDRDTMEQIVLNIDEVVDYINEKIKF